MRVLACSSGKNGLARVVGSESARVNLKRQVSKECETLHHEY